MSRKIPKKPSRRKLDAAARRRPKPGAGAEARGGASDLAASEQRYRLLFEHNLAGVYCTRLDGTILDCNESMATMLGYGSREELLACRAQDLYFTEASRAAFLAKLRQSGNLTNSDLCLKRKDGSPVYILENVSLVPDDKGRPFTIQGTMVDITERKRTEEALRESEQAHRRLVEDLRRLSQHQQAVRDEERGRIARELHDEMGQTLTAMRMDLHWLQAHPGAKPADAQARIASMAGLLDSTIQAVHRICADLRPPILDDFGLVAALEWQVQEFEARTGIPCRLKAPRREPKLSPGQKTAAFRIFQESLTNVIRHAKATDVRVHLTVRGGRLVLEVKDDGVGIPAQRAASPSSLGLAGMRERALSWGGRLDVIGEPGRGTIVTLSMPAESGASGESP